MVKKIAKYGGKWDFWGQTAILLTSYKYSYLCPMRSIDINCDLGEGFANDAALMPLISSANIACGYHAGDADTIRQTIDLALRHGVAIGAHPGFADKAHFGRRALRLEPAAYYDLVSAQIEILSKAARAAGARLRHVKPHGALYNMSARDPALAAIIAQAVRDFDPTLLLFGLSGSAAIKAGEAAGLQTVSEVFADRTYQSDGALTPREQAGALLEDEAACREQAYNLVLRGRARASDGAELAVCAQSICLHGDGAQAVEFARMLRDFLGQFAEIAAPIRTSEA